MDKQAKPRKKRSDRTHIIYQLEAPNGDFYIGITHKDGGIDASVRRRFAKHVGRAINEDKNWSLCVAIREHGPEAFTFVVLDTVRGKAPAHKIERQLISQLKPTLNSDIREMAGA
jgi:predicted GIY-YIG superfamily endonuclease